MTDPIADMLTRIRNAYMAGKKETVIPFSNQKLAIAQKLVELGYLAEANETQADAHRNLTVKLKYVGKHPSATGINRVSSPGRRIYTSSKDIKSVLSGYGSTLISTSKGIMSGVEAKKAGLGGEIICKVW